jgi:DNA ligase-associated metallophosphoesterase
VTAVAAGASTSSGQCREIPIGRLEGVPHCSGALYLAAERTLLMSDLHLEKGSCFARRGVFLPPYDTRATLASCALAIAAFDPRRVICMGDSFHDRQGASRLDEADAAMLRALQLGREWLWLTGNHDPEAAPGFEGDVAAEAAIAGVALRHEPAASPGGPEIAGHLHPAARIRIRGKSLRRRCFAGDGDRLVMPAMGAFAGGLNLTSRPFHGLFEGGADAWMLGDGRVFSIGRALLLGD